MAEKTKMKQEEKWVVEMTKVMGRLARLHRERPYAHLTGKTKDKLDMAFIGLYEGMNYAKADLGLPQ